VLLRVTASADKASLNATSTAATEREAALNAPDADTTALTRADVSAERAARMLASADDSDGTAAPLSEATALTRAAVSPDTSVLNAETTFNVLAFSVKLWLLLSSDAIFSNVLNREGAPLKMF
jgi:hypothetical protein